jgi:hypothetical protein
MTLSGRDRSTALATLGVDHQTAGEPEFSEDGRFLAWGNRDGTVFVADLPEVQRRLERIGLGW